MCIIPLPKEYKVVYKKETVLKLLMKFIKMIASTSKADPV